MRTHEAELRFRPRCAIACIALLAGSCASGGHSAASHPPLPFVSPLVSKSTSPETTCIPPTPLPAGSGAFPALDPQSVTFVSLEHGWVWGPSACAAQGGAHEGVLAETQDRGSRWAIVPTTGIDYDFFDGPGAFGVRFADASDGFLFGHDWYVTHDGGRSWTKRRSPGPIAALETTATRTYALVATCHSAPGSGCSTVGLYAGPVSADHLTRVSDVPPAADATLVIHGDAVFVLAPPMTYGVTGTVWASPDGTHWAHHSSPCTWGGAASGSLAAWSSRGLAVVCGSQPGAGNQEKTAYESLDAGAHWQRRGLLGSPGYVGSLAAANQNDLALGEGRDGLVSSRDGGRTWRDAPLLGLSGQFFDGWAYAGFTDATHGVAVPELNGSALAFTSDAGATWRLRFFPSGR